MNLFSQDRVMGSSNVLNEFTKIEDSIKHQEPLTIEEKDRNLKKNLATAMKYSIHKKYMDYKDRIKDLKPEALNFYQEPGTFNYIVQFKNYFGYYNFSVDPEIYIQLPVDEKFYTKTTTNKEEDQQNIKLNNVKATSNIPMKN